MLRIEQEIILTIWNIICIFL